MRHTLFLVALLLFAAQSASDNTRSKSRAQSLVLQPCSVPQIKDKAQCGNLEVFENRSSRKGRKISLKILVLPATGNDRAADPLFYIPGGPGSSATEDAPGIAPIFAKVHERHDLVFLDQRGTGGAHPPHCEVYNPTHPPAYLLYFLFFV